MMIPVILSAIVIMALGFSIFFVTAKRKRAVFTGMHIIMPVMIMFALAALSFSNPFHEAGSWYSMNFIMESLILYYPVLFFVQGLVCAWIKANIVLSLGISTAAYTIILFIWLNSSALMYIIVYILMGLLGYSLALLVKNVVNQSQAR